MLVVVEVGIQLEGLEVLVEVEIENLMELEMEVLVQQIHDDEVVEYLVHEQHPDMIEEAELLLYPMQRIEVTEYLLLLLEEQLRQVVDKLFIHSQQVEHLQW